MNRTILSASLVFTVLLVAVSCSKDSSNDGGGGTVMTPLEKKADSLRTYVKGKHFIPVDFYSSRPIDYDQDDATIKSETNLKPYIFGYLADDVIVFQDNGKLSVDQMDSMYSGKPEKVFTADWNVETSKALNVVYLNYLDYYYLPKRYTLSTFNDTTMIAYVSWASKIDPTDTATLYTRFLKK